MEKLQKEENKMQEIKMKASHYATGLIFSPPKYEQF